MKMLICGFAMSLGVIASDAKADKVLNIDGEEYLLSTLLENCQSIADAAAQIDCVSNISRALDEQTAAAQKSSVSVPDALDALRAVAQYQDDDSGLSIAGSDCNIHIVYFNNYFHISRRNVSTIDLFSAQFDASKLLYDQITEVQGVQAPLLKGAMDAGANAAMRGGAALDSTMDNFSSRSSRTTIDAYANEVVNQLPARQEQAVDFVLVHPQRSQASAEIWDAFEVFVSACKG